MQARRRPGGKRTSDRRAGGPCHARTLAPATITTKKHICRPSFLEIIIILLHIVWVIDGVCVYVYEYRVPSILYYYYQLCPLIRSTRSKSTCCYYNNNNIRVITIVVLYTSIWNSSFSPRRLFRPVIKVCSYYKNHFYCIDWHIIFGSPVRWKRTRACSQHFSKLFFLPSHVHTTTPLPCTGSPGSFFRFDRENRKIWSDVDDNRSDSFPGSDDSKSRSTIRVVVVKNFFFSSSSGFLTFVHFVCVQKYE